MTNNFQRVSVSTIAVGDIILPPERELQLWMRRYVLDNGLTSAALHLTVVSISEEGPDKRGIWLVFRTTQAPEWGARQPFVFRARPETQWSMIRRTL